VCYKTRSGVMQASWATSDARGDVAGGRGKWAGGGSNGSRQRFETGCVPPYRVLPNLLRFN
jgi:hypothetical protein